MPVRYVPLGENDPEARKFIGDQIVGAYLDGQCYEFALALSEGLGWPMVGIRALHNGEETIRHVVLEMPGCDYFDARGQITLNELGNPFGLTREEFFLSYPIYREDIEAIRPVSDHSIQLARRMAETYWSVLPWKDSLAERAMRFATDLEKLSRKHGIWIFGHLPTTWPGLSESDGGDERGYTIAANPTGISMRINRRLLHEE